MAGDSKILPVPAGPFQTVSMDPPWPYRNSQTRNAATKHYSTMTLDDIRMLDLPVGDQAHLYLWTTPLHLATALDLMAGWGFTYKTMLVWVKNRIGMGNWWRTNAEFVLFGVKGGLKLHRDLDSHGRPAPMPWTTFTNLWYGPRPPDGTLTPNRNGRVKWPTMPMLRHSSKPDIFYELVADASPGPYLEMFARAPRDGWTTWGDESGG